METAYGDSSSEILSIYPPPCLDDENPLCGSFEVATNWMNGKHFWDMGF